MLSCERLCCNNVCDCYSFFWSTPIVPAEPQADGQTDSAQEDQRNCAQDQLAANDALHNGALVLCNPGASDITDTDPENPTSHAGENQDGKAPEESRESEAGSSGMPLTVIQKK